jgi:hypothetical protein
MSAVSFAIYSLATGRIRRVGTAASLEDAQRQVRAGEGIYIGAADPRIHQINLVTGELEILGGSTAVVNGPFTEKTRGTLEITTFPALVLVLWDTTGEQLFGGPLAVGVHGITFEEDGRYRVVVRQEGRVPQSFSVLVNALD